jgi:DNA-directed RNA polymerase subunit omega
MPVMNDPPRNKFAYVVVAAKRARQLQNGAPPLVHLNRPRKHTRIAEDELVAGQLEYELPEMPEWDEEVTGKKKKG